MTGPTMGRSQQASSTVGPAQNRTPVERHNESTSGFGLAVPSAGGLSAYLDGGLTDDSHIDGN